MTPQSKIKAYTYTRVSTAMQIEGYSLDAQKNRMKDFAEFNTFWRTSMDLFEKIKDIDKPELKMKLINFSRLCMKNRCNNTLVCFGIS